MLLPSCDGFLGEPPSGPLFRDAEGRCIYDSSDELAAKLGMQDNVDDWQRTSTGEGNRVETLANRQAWSEMKHSEAEADLKENVEKQDSEMKGVRSRTDLLWKTIGELLLHIQVLEKVALKYRPSAVAALVRRQLDDARCCIAKGIVTTFPGLYDPDYILNPHDPLQTTVYWSAFKSAISCHFWRLHGRATGDEAYRLVQTESVFVDCHARRLYMIGSLAQERVSTRERPFAAVAAGGFTNKVVDTFPMRAVENGEVVSVDMTYEPYAERVMRHILNFFVPALAWAYTELKKHVVRADAIIQDLENSNAGQRHLTNHPRDTAPSEVPKSYDGEMNSRFTHGTAFDVRKEEFWKAYAKQLGPKDVYRGNKLYDCWRDEYAIYETIEREEAIRAEEEKRALEDAFPYVRSHPAFIPPANGVKHTPTTRVIDSSDERKRSSNCVAQSVDSPNKARKAEESSSPHSRTWDHTGALNARRFLTKDKAELEKVQERRRIHVARLTTIHKCLSILLDSDLVDFAIIGESHVRLAMNDGVHKPFFYNPADLDSLDRVLEVVSDCPHLTGMGMTGNNYKEQIAKLRDLMGKRKEEGRCFDDPEVTLSMEVALDKHLSDKARLASQSKNSEDIHLIMSYLDDVKPTY